MKLYHFTSVPLAESCMSSGISEGRVQWSDGSFYRPIVWLTTDADWRGHGLLTGNEVLSDADIRYVELMEGRSAKNRPIANKTEIRITVKIPQADRRLFAFEKFIRKHGREPHVSEYMKSMGLSAAGDPRRLSEKEFTDFVNNTVTKERTWWLYNGIIRPESFSAIQFLTPEGYRDYDFETHGRQVFLQAGLVAPSCSALTELSEIIPGNGKFNPVGAFCFCEKESDDPSVIIRDAGRDRKIRISPENRNPLMISGDAQSAQWVKKHHDELMDCWTKSVEIFRNISS